MSNIDITDGDLKQLIESNEKPVLVDFWAPWCGPCRAMAPTIEAIASERVDISVVKINVDEQTEYSGKYGVQSIPTLLLINGGKVLWTSTGNQSRAKIDEAIEKNLATT